MAKNLVLGPIFSHSVQIWAAIFFIFFFFKNLAVTRYHGQLSSCKISEKTNDPILRKLSDDFINKSDFIGRCQTNFERPTCFNIKNFTRNHLRVTADRIISQYFLPEKALQNCSNEEVL